MRFLLSLFFTTAVLATPYNGIDDYTAVECGPEFNDLNYSLRVVAMMPVETQPSTFGRAMYTAASASTSTAYVYLGAPDTKLVASFTHRSSFFYTAESTFNMADGVFHVYCGVADGTTLKLYVDGVLQASAPMSSATSTTRGLCTVGALRRSSGYLGSFWQGEISELQTWDFALSESEVAQHCAALVSPPTNLCDTQGPQYGGELKPPCDADITTNCRVPCSPERQRIACACSECMQWTPTPDATVTHYEIQRTSALGQQILTLPLTVDDQGYRIHPSSWCFWKEPNFTPHEALYTYTVRACSDNLCSAWTPPIDYVPAPHTVLP